MNHLLFDFIHQNLFRRIVAAASFLLAGISIFTSDNPLIFTALFVITTILFFAIPRARITGILFLIALGPVLNMAVFFRDPYLYPMDIILLAYLGLYFLFPGNHPNQSEKTIRLVTFFLLSVFIVSMIHIFRGIPFLSELRLVRPYFLAFLLMMFVAENRTVLMQHFATFYRISLLSAALIIGAAAFQYITFSVLAGNWLKEPSSFFSGSEAFAVYLIFVLPLLLFDRHYSGINILKNLSIPVFGLGFLVLLATRSRAALIAIPVLAGIYLFTSGSGIRRKYWIIPLIILFLLAAGSIFFLKSWAGIHIANTGFGDLIRSALSSRLENWNYALAQIGQAPLWGNGPVNNVYSLYLQIGAQFGLISMHIFFAFISKLIFDGFRMLSKKAEYKPPVGLFLGFLGILVASFAESTIGNQTGYWVWFTFLYLVILIRIPDPATASFSRP